MNIPFTQAVGSGCNVAFRQQVTLQPKKQENGGQESGAPRSISWGPEEPGHSEQTQQPEPQVCLPMPTRQTPRGSPSVE